MQNLTLLITSWKGILEVFGLEINKEKSATNDNCCEDTATLLEGVSVYKYLGIIEDSRGIPTLRSLKKYKANLYQELKNLLDDAVRVVLVKNKIHLCPRCKERLYLSTTELEEAFIVLILDCLEKSKGISTRRGTIHKVENINKTHLALIKGFLKGKYRLVEKVNKKSLEEAQLEKLYNKIEKRKLHLKLYNSRENELGCVRADGVYQHCGKSGKTVDHLATRCEKMLGHDYARRHNEVVRWPHLLLSNRYKFKSSKRIRSHSVQEILDNEYSEIIVDTRIKTDVKIRNNRPDIFILYKKKNKITLIEVGITSQNSLQIYELLANDLGLIYRCSVEIITLCDELGGIRVSMGVIMRAEMHEEPTPPLKSEKIGEDGAKNFKPKNKAPLISQGGTTLEKPTNNINKDSDLEEETKVVNR
ncbi:hypothetical protein CWI36_2181p0010 [Hamiltosporidium magnivora]|uniref:Reverse transcriptase n=1 Tax=Hamiltosporidium magnivora TaxID=148818 RepID=A0A4Q9KWB3_9MICR|nr:hypothetical protein CWI36_2181p0010 [Hamiltosporidium magnivora]